MAGRLNDKVAVNTGGTSGIGEATARLFVAEGAKVVIAGRSIQAGEAIAAELGSNAAFVQTDVTREEDIVRAIRSAVDKWGRLDCLFNNAGGPTPGRMEDVTPEQFRYAMDLLLGSVVLGIKHAAPIMKAQGSGRIINNSSVNAIRVASGDWLYGAAKAGVTQITKSAGVALAPFGITVNCISPGAVATPIFYGGSAVGRGLEPAHESAKLRKLTENLGKATPVGRSGLPIDTAYAVLYLASDEGAYINAHDLVVDGGMTARGTW